MKSELNYILTLAAAIFSTVAGLIFIWAAWRAAKRDPLLFQAYKVDVEKLMIELRRDYAQRLKSGKSDSLSPQR